MPKRRIQEPHLRSDRSLSVAPIRLLAVTQHVTLSPPPQLSACTLINTQHSWYRFWLGTLQQQLLYQDFIRPITCRQHFKKLDILWSKESIGKCLDLHDQILFIRAYLMTESVHIIHPVLLVLLLCLGFYKASWCSEICFIPPPSTACQLGFLRVCVCVCVRVQHFIKYYELY